MKYFRIEKDTNERTEITLGEAKEWLAMYYVERVCTFDEMLSWKGWIPGMFSDLEVTED